MNPSTPCRPPGCGDELPHTRQAPQLPPLSGKMSTLCWQELLGFCRVWGQRDVGHGPAPKPLGLGSHEYGSARFGALTSSLLPLKLGRMRASYPEVRPISLSRKSEGDMGLGEPREPALISSRPETSLRGRGGRSAAVCWHQGSAGTFWQPVGTLSCQGRCACAASTPVPSQHAGGIPSFCWDPAASPLTCNSLSSSCPHFSCPCSTTSLGMEGTVPPGSKAVLGTGHNQSWRGKAGKLLLRFHLQLQLELLSNHTLPVVAWGDWGTQRPCLSEVSRAQLTPCQGPGRCGRRGAVKPTSTPAMVMSSPTQHSE